MSYSRGPEHTNNTGSATPEATDRKTPQRNQPHANGPHSRHFGRPEKCLENSHEGRGNSRNPVLLSAALWYAGRGIPVFPLRPGSKNPAVPKREGGRGYLDATTDPEQIRRWWSRWPLANIGIPTGERSGLLVLDHDAYKPEAISREDLERKHGPIPKTLT
ncbi:MAG: bifunctional DNA primase/polymerase, partial [Actinomycetota bacterium]|nr:bifunctional DNA primase/polymerase [Actinomycetota bacterium]